MYMEYAILFHCLILKLVNGKQKTPKFRESSLYCYVKLD